MIFQGWKIGNLGYQSGSTYRWGLGKRLGKTPRPKQITTLEPWNQISHQGDKHRMVLSTCLFRLGSVRINGLACISSGYPPYLSFSLANISHLSSALTLSRFLFARQLFQLPALITIIGPMDPLTLNLYRCGRYGDRPCHYMIHLV